MKALSIRQPWAWLICAGYKDVENRSWWIHMPPLLRGYPATPRRIYVHTGKTMDKTGEWLEYCQARLSSEQWQRFWQFIMAPEPTTLGAIVGEVDITGCVEKSDSPWFVGPYGFTLANPVLYKTPIPCKGRLGFFEPNLTPSMISSLQNGGNVRLECIGSIPI